jgi:hypothetical protein
MKILGIELESTRIWKDVIIVCFKVIILRRGYFSANIESGTFEYK